MGGGRNFHRADKGRLWYTTGFLRTVHAYAIDKLGRTTADSVTTLGLNVDDAVRRIETEFDVQSRLVTVTSFSTPAPVSESSSSSGDTVMNQIAYTYDPFGQLATEAQEHAGPVEGSTPVVTYTRADGSAGTARLTRITYPNGRNVDFDYGAADSDADLLSRVAAVKDPATPTFVEYTWLGLATAALTKYPLQRNNIAPPTRPTRSPISSAVGGPPGRFRNTTETAMP